MQWIEKSIPKMINQEAYAFTCVRKRRKFCDEARKTSGYHAIAWTALPAFSQSGFLRPSNKVWQFQPTLLKLISMRNITEILKELDEFPYGNELNHKTLAPNKYHYKNLIEELIALLSILPIEIQKLNEILSIRDNELRELMINNDNDSFVKYGADDQMITINKLIHLSLDSYFYDKQ